MNYTVIWLPPALAQLAAIWTASGDRNGVTAASSRLDLRLAADPLNEGESREEMNVRITFDAPLRILFRVIPERNEVHVYSLSIFSRRA